MSEKKSCVTEVCCGRIASLTLCHRIVIVVSIFCTVSTSKKIRAIKINSNNTRLLENFPALKHHRKFMFGLTD